LILSWTDGVLYWWLERVTCHEHTKVLLLLPPPAAAVTSEGPVGADDGARPGGGDE